MIIVRLKYRLGNQMFQYALGRCLAQKLNEELFLDTTWLEQNKGAALNLDYRLHMFNIKAKIIDRLSADLLPRALVISVHENTVGFFEEVLHLRAPKPGALILTGTWQSQKYFIEAADAIRKEFTLVNFPNEERGLADIIDSTCAVAVHVRRGDYVSSQLGAHLGFVGLDYYDRAISILTDRVPDAHFFVFSDDIDWCAANLKLRQPHTFVARSSSDTFVIEDFHLMSRCSHFIIANSTYSWLSSKTDKVIVAPNRWFGDKQWDSSHIIPATWIVT